MFDFLRERTKSSTEITQEALNAYLDNALAAAERQRLEQQLGQDARLRAELQQLRVLKQQFPILLVEHDMEAVFALADRVTVLVYGRVIASDLPTRIRANEEVRQAYLGEQEAVEAKDA